MIRRAAAPVALAASVALLSGCAAASISTSASAGGPVRIVASTNVYGDLAATIGGSAVSVTSVISDPSKDPHQYEADARTQLAIARAQIVVENGGGYDAFMDSMRTAAKSSATVLNAVTISGKDASASGFNEHVWYDYPTVKKVVTAMTAAIEKAAPTSASAVASRAAALQSELDALVAAETAARSTTGGKDVAITEPVPLYLLDALGAVDRTPEAFSKAVETGTDAPVAVLQQALDLLTRKRVAGLVYNAQTSGPQTDAVVAAATKAGVPVVAVTETLPQGAHYVAWQKALLAETVAALSR